mmetsp:Transcript_34416/g.38522  ORF Transcript_34416/g.38522 Transcript_34416/m.38522 type:complete len:174 (+) Transcript_34416:158-679(+)
MSKEESQAFKERLRKLVIIEFAYDLPMAEPPSDRPKIIERYNGDDYYNLDNNFLLNALNEGVVHVEFEKADGEMRSLLCTRDLRIVPSNMQPKDKEAHRNDNSAIVRVFEVGFTPGTENQLGDVVFKDWCSFRSTKKSIKKLRFDHMSVSVYVRYMAERNNFRIAQMPCEYIL